MRRCVIFLILIGFLMMPVHGAEEPKYVALTFDDGPSGRFTRALLDGLDQRDAKATFLLCGYRIAQQPEVTQRIFDEGHEIGIHGYSHDCMTKLCLGQIQREINDCLLLLPSGCHPAFLRPPGGLVNGTVRQAAKEAGLAILGWSVDPRDWATHDTAQVEQAVLEKVRDGDIILLHDMSESSVEAALFIVDTLQDQGFRFVTVSELARLRGAAIEPGKSYHRFLV